MICLLDSSEALIFPKGHNEFIVTKILANDISYGRNFGFLNFWYQKIGEDVTATLCKFEETIFLTASASADFTELKEFISVIGFKNLQTEKNTLTSLGLKGQDFICLAKEGSGQKSVPDKNININLAYNILFADQEESIAKIDFEGFYVDFSHRLRHGTASCEVLDDSATATASHITKNTAIISGVAVKKEKRRSGVGSLVLKNLLKKLGCCKVYVACNEQTANFYIKNGFKPETYISEYRS